MVDSVIISYLAKAEGITVHKGATESTITSPYGIYKKSFPNEEIFTYIDAKALEIGVNLNLKQGRRIYNNTFKHDCKYQEKIEKYVVEFYKKNFIPSELFSMLTEAEQLVLFSISVNTGKSNGNKALQFALGVKQDGVVGNITKRALTNNDCTRLELPMLQHLNAKYLRLLKRRPKKFEINRNGWMNRIENLGVLVGQEPGWLDTLKRERLWA